MIFRLVQELAAGAGYARGGGPAGCCASRSPATTGGLVGHRHRVRWQTKRSRHRSARSTSTPARRTGRRGCMLNCDWVAVVHCSRKRVAGLMRSASLCGIDRRRRRRASPAAPVSEHLVQRRLQADAPDRLWLTDITEHPTREKGIPGSGAGRLPTAHLRLVDRRSSAQRARRGCARDGTLAPASCSLPDGAPLGPRGAVHVVAFGHQLRDAGLLGSTGRLGCAYDNAVMESFFSTLQRELLDVLSPIAHERLYTATVDSA